MKKMIIPLFALLSFISLNSKNFLLDQFDISRVTTNYNGSVYNGSSILVYGDAGTIVRSTDGGINWEQIQLFDEYKIVSIVNLNGNYYGAFNKDYLIKSTDNGISWSYIPSNGLNLYKIKTFDNKLYCMIENKIIIYDVNLNQTDEIPIDVKDSNYYNFEIMQNKIYYPSGKGKLTEYNLMSKESKEIDLSNIGLNDASILPTNLFVENNKLYFNQKYQLCSYQNNSASLVFKPIKNGVYCGNSNEIFELYNVTFNPTNIDSLYFVKINTNQTSTRINQNINDRYVTYMNFTNINFLSKDTIIAVGKNKLIYMSSNRGKNWNLISHYNPAKEPGEIQRYEEDYGILVSEGIKFIKTTDSGITWLPQKNYDPYFISGTRFTDLFNSGYSFLNIDKNTTYSYYNADVQGDTNLALTKDGGNTTILKNINNIIGISIHMNEQSVLLNTTVGKYFSYPCHIYSHYFHKLFKIDDNINFEYLGYIDSVNFNFFDDYNGKFIGFAKNFRYPRKISETVYEFDSTYMSLYISNEDLKSWECKFDYYNFNYLSVFSVSRIGDNLYLIMKKGADDYDLYQLNLLNYELKKIFTLPPGSYPSNKSVQKINNIYFTTITFLGNNGVITNNYYNDGDITDSLNWKITESDGRYSALTINNYHDSLFVIYSYDSLMKSKVIWFAKLKNTVSVEEIKENKTYLYISNPYPNPAEEFSKTRIYFSQCSNFEEASIKIYNILGEEVGSNADLNFQYLNIYTVELNWNCSKVNPGIYFINVSLNGETQTKAIIKL